MATAPRSCAGVEPKGAVEGAHRGSFGAGDDNLRGGHVSLPLERNERGVVIGLFLHDPSRTALAVYIGVAARQG